MHDTMRCDAMKQILQNPRTGQTEVAQVPGIAFMPQAPYGRCTRWLSVILTTPEELGADREAVRIALEAENIESRPVWKPMHLQPVFEITPDEGGPKAASPAASRAAAAPKERVRARSEGGAVSEDLFARGLCLPSGTQMNEEDLARVVEVIKRTRGAKRAA